MWGWIVGEEETGTATAADTSEKDTSAVPSADHVPDSDPSSDTTPRLIESSDTTDEKETGIDTSTVSEPITDTAESRVTFNPFSTMFEKHSKSNPSMVSACTPLRCTFYERPQISIPAAEDQTELGSKSAPDMTAVGGQKRASVGSAGGRRRSLMDLFSTTVLDESTAEATSDTDPTQISKKSEVEEEHDDDDDEEEESDQSSLGFDPDLIVDELLTDDTIPSKDFFGRKELLLKFVNQYDELSEKEKNDVINYHKWIMHDTLTLSILGMIPSTTAVTIDDTSGETSSTAITEAVSTTDEKKDESVESKEDSNSSGDGNDKNRDDLCIGDVLLCYFASFSPTNPDLKGCWHRWLNYRSDLTLNKVDYKLIMEYWSKKPMNLAYDENKQPLLVLDSQAYIDEYGPEITAKLVELFVTSILWNLEENTFDFNGLRNGVSIYVNLSHFSVTMFSWNVITQVKIAAVSYPFGLEKIYCVNTPTIIYLIRQFAASVLVPHAMEKIQIIENTDDFIEKDEYPGVKKDMPIDCGGDWSIDGIRWMGPRGFLMPLEIDDDMLDSILDDDLDLDLDDSDSDLEAGEEEQAATEVKEMG